ncbi:MAG: DNA glycosylase AlkZ-like family protein [Anaerolineae bacterium]
MTLTQAQVEQLRNERYHRLPARRLRSEDDAVRFVDEVGFCLLFPVQGMELPSLWEAINGCRRPVPRHHDDYELGLTWRWKDTLPSQKRIFYGKILKGKATLISLALLPYFYALSENYGDLDDYLLEYEDGLLSEEAKRIYEVLLERGASPTGVLRREAGLWGKSNMARFDRALVELQRGLKIAKVGISDANRWGYSYVYDLLPRWLPHVPKQAREITRAEARQRLITKYLDTVVVATADQMARLFGWEREWVAGALRRLIEEGLVTQVEVEGLTGEYLCPTILTRSGIERHPHRG